MAGNQELGTKVTPSLNLCLSATVPIRADDRRGETKCQGTKGRGLGFEDSRGRVADPHIADCRLMVEWNPGVKESRGRVADLHIADWARRGLSTDYADYADGSDEEAGTRNSTTKTQRH
jgi:hypothetical protein